MELMGFVLVSMIGILGVGLVILFLIWLGKKLELP